MDKQGSLFDGAEILDPKGMSHRGDPQTSVEAAARHVANGRFARHLELVYGLVERLPGHTAIELWHMASSAEQAQLAEPQEVRRRLTDLLALKRVRQDEPRHCRYRGTRQVTWQLA